MSEMRTMLLRYECGAQTSCIAAVAAQLKESGMFAVTGITGQVGGAVARALIAAGKNVRAVVRDGDKGADGRGKVVKSRSRRWTTPRH